jgi:tRNA(fMet)-specific endonuclease VapC
LDDVIGDEDDVAIAAITAAELLVGVELADKRRKSSRERFVEEILQSIPVETYDVNIARHHARWLAEVKRAGRPRGAHDPMIAATAVARDRAVVTTNVGHFKDLPEVRVVPLPAPLPPILNFGEDLE